MQSEIDALESVFTVSRAAAETAAENAAASETAAAGSAADSENSAVNAAQSAANSAQSASTALEHTETAGTKAAEAAASAVAAAASAAEAAQIVGGDYATKVSGAVAGNLAGLNVSGNLVDSGKKPQDFAGAADMEAALAGKAAAVHAANHATGGADPLTPAQIGAAVTTTLTATVPVAWTASGGFYSQTVSVPGMLATDNATVDILTGSDNAANKLYQEALGKVLRIIAGAGTATLWATEAPTIAFPLQFKVVR